MTVLNILEYDKYISVDRNDSNCSYDGKTIKKGTSGAGWRLLKIVVADYNNDQGENDEKKKKTIYFNNVGIEHEPIDSALHYSEAKEEQSYHLWKIQTSYYFYQDSYTHKTSYLWHYCSIQWDSAGIPSDASQTTPNDVRNSEQLHSITLVDEFDISVNPGSREAPKEKTFDQLSKTLKEHLEPKPQTIVERFHFHRRNQEQSESVLDYIAELRRLSATCDFGGYLNEVLRDRFVCGLSNEATQKRLLTEQNLDLAKALGVAQAMEAAQKNALQFKDLSVGRVKLDPKGSQVAEKQTFPKNDYLLVQHDSQHILVKRFLYVVKSRLKSVPFALKEGIEEELERLEKEGIVHRVMHSEWATPIVPILKPDKKVRICGDFKVTINPALDVDRYPVPKLEELLATESGGKWFSKLDLTNAYLQLALDEESQKLCTLNTHRGLYQYRRMPFRIASAPALFQKTMDSVLQGIKHVVCYIDDILVTGSNEIEHLRNLEQVFNRLKEHGIRLRMVNYYAKFLPNVSTHLFPLYALLKKEHGWKWDKECQHAFVLIKKMLSSTQVLTPYDPKLPLRLAADASAYGLGAVLSHEWPDGSECPIAFASRTLASAERHYALLEKEALALIFGIKKFHLYLYGRPINGKMFILLVDAHSKWPEVFEMPNTTSQKTIEILRQVFSAYGLPEQLVSDNGPQFISREFAEFMAKNGIKHIRSAPYHPATNGHMERFVQTFKRPLKTGTTKREVRTRLHLLRETTEQQVCKKQAEQKWHHDKKARDRECAERETVLSRNYGSDPKWVRGRIGKQCGPVSYQVELPDGRVWRRHIEQLSAVPEAVCVPVPTTKVDERAPDMTEPVEVAEETRPREELMRQPEITSTDLDIQDSNPTASNEQGGVRRNEGQSTEGKAPHDHRTTTTTPSTTRRYPERTRRPPERF
eukprot:Em0004g1477a